MTFVNKRAFSISTITSFIPSLERLTKLMKVLGVLEDLFLKRTLIDVSDMTKLKYEKMVMMTVLYLGSAFDE